MTTSDKTAINGMQIDLSNGRHVWVGAYKDGTLVQLCNSDGDITRLRLSNEAADALRYLLSKPTDPDRLIKSVIHHMVAASEATAQQFRWEAVPVDTTPHAVR